MLLHHWVLEDQNSQAHQISPKVLSVPHRWIQHAHLNTCNPLPADKGYNYIHKMTDCFVSLKAKPIHVIVAATNAKTFKTWITRKMICHLNSNDLANPHGSSSTQRRVDQLPHILLIVCTSSGQMWKTLLPEWFTESVFPSPPTSWLKFTVSRNS